MDKPVLNVFDVMAKLKVSKSMAYRVIRDLNRELKQKGYYVVNGRVSSDYFKEKFNLNADEYKEDDPQEIEKKEKTKKESLQPLPQAPINSPKQI